MNARSVMDCQEVRCNIGGKTPGHAWNYVRRNGYVVLSIDLYGYVELIVISVFMISLARPWVTSVMPVEAVGAIRS